MTLTPADVEATTFRTAMRGYNMTEVDTFLDQVASDLGRLLSENSTLRERAGGLPPEEIVASGPVSDSAEAPAPEAPAPDAPAPDAPAPEAPAAERSGIRPGEGGEEAALRTLLLAQRTADQVVAEAREEAEQILGRAREEAEQTERAAAERVEALDARATEQSERLEQEAAQTRDRVLGELEAQRAQLQAEIERLRAFEREYRSRLKAYLESQLREVEGRAPAPPQAVSQDGPADTGTAASEDRS
jgi:DivIVA domain-containing protein